MPRETVNQRVERLRKKLADKKANAVLITDKEAFEVLKTEGTITDSDNVIEYAIGECCGLVHDDGTCIPCMKRVVLEAYPFCSVEHQRKFESTFPEFMNENFYNTVALVNLYRSDLHWRFYTEYLPALHVLFARQDGSTLALFAEDDKQARAFREAIDAPFEKCTKFCDDAKKDLQELRKAIRTCELLKTCVSNARSCENFSVAVESQNIVLVSPRNSPRSAKNSPRTAGNSPRQPSGLQETSS